MKTTFSKQTQPIPLMIVILITAIFFSGKSNSSEKTPCDLSCMEQKALLGDGDVAYRLGNESMYSDRERMKYWYRISAENGSIKGQYNYAHFLTVDSKDADDCYRAIFWFSKAAASGHKTAANAHKILLKATQSGEKFQRGCARHYD